MEFPACQLSGCIITKTHLAISIFLIAKNEIKAGDTIICSDGLMRTVCNNNIKKDSFMGISIHGSAYPIVEKVIIKKSMPI